MGTKLDAAVAKVNKSFGLRVAPLSSHDLDVKAISTGNIALDSITGVRGLPRGRLIELYGPPSSGKSSMALQCAAHAQKLGLTIVYLDYEQAMDPNYCKNLGLDVDAPSFLFGQPDFAEQGFNAIRELIDTGEVGLVIFDSVGAMATEKELSVVTGKSTFADKAKMMAQAMRQITPSVAKHDVVCIFLNHIQDVIDSSPMGQKLAASGVKRTTTPGGKALKFHASVRIEFKPIGGMREAVEDELTNESSDVVMQQKVNITVVKNKVAAPFKTCEARVRFGVGFSQAYSVLAILTAYKVIRKEAGGVFRFDEITQPPGMDVEANPKQNWIRGENKLLELMEQNPAWTEQLGLLAQDCLTKAAPLRAGASLSTQDVGAVQPDEQEAKDEDLKEPETASP